MYGLVRDGLALAAFGALALAAACGGGDSHTPSDAGATMSTAGASPVSASGTGGSSASEGGTGGKPAAAAGTGGAAANGGSGGRSTAGASAGAGAGAGGREAPRDAGMPPVKEDAGMMMPEPSANDAGMSPAECGRCEAYASPMQSGTIEPSELNALSGIAFSHSQPEIIFAHNDHERAVVYALDVQGKLHARITLESAMATDIEDIAAGPCGAQRCVFLADVGDNAAQRREYAILRFAEPTVPAMPGSSAMTATSERYRFTYEDGSHNAESLMVGPDGTIYIITKLAPGSGGAVTANGASSVYRLAAPFSTTTVARATKVATLPVPASGDQAASAAAAHPCGQGFLLRTYNRVYEFVTPNGGNFEAAFGVMPSVVAMPDEAQSEGIDYRADGKGFMTSGEGTRAPLMLTNCR